MTLHRFLLALALVAAPVAAQDISGSARATDGDTLNMTGIIIRLHGIDAPEYRQTCARGAKTWACGADAANALAAFVDGKAVSCEQRDIDEYDRIVATCRVGGTDLSAAMVDAGLAVALPRFTTAYVGNEQRARERGIGLWGSTFDMPADYRATHPVPHRRAAPPITTMAPRPAPDRPAATAFRNCKEAWAAGAAPLHRGQPGYRPEMDGDGDGIACEPYRGRE